MSYSKTIVCVLIFILTALKLLFSLKKIRLKNYRLPFELIYICSVAISVIRVSQYINLYLEGCLSYRNFETSFLLEIGTYILNIFSMATYFIKQNIDKMTGEIYDKCEVCNGDLYAFGAPEVINKHHVCGACARTINEIKS